MRSGVIGILQLVGGQVGTTVLKNDLALVSKVKEAYT